MIRPCCRRRVRCDCRWIRRTLRSRRTIAAEVTALSNRIVTPDGRGVVTAPRYDAPFTDPESAAPQPDTWIDELRSDPRVRGRAGLGSWSGDRMAGPDHRRRGGQGRRSRDRRRPDPARRARRRGQPVAVAPPRGDRGFRGASCSVCSHRCSAGCRPRPAARCSMGRRVTHPISPPRCCRRPPAGLCGPVPPARRWRRPARAAMATFSRWRPPGARRTPRTPPTSPAAQAIPAIKEAVFEAAQGDDALAEWILNRLGDSPSLGLLAAALAALAPGPDGDRTPTRSRRSYRPANSPIPTCR